LARSDTPSHWMLHRRKNWTFHRTENEPEAPEDNYLYFRVGVSYLASYSSVVEKQGPTISKIEKGSQLFTESLFTSA